jgi:hypothetical protein
MRCVAFFHRQLTCRFLQGANLALENCAYNARDRPMSFLAPRLSMESICAYLPLTASGFRRRGGCQSPGLLVLFCPLAKPGTRPRWSQALPHKRNRARRRGADSSWFVRFALKRLGSSLVGCSVYRSCAVCRPARGRRTRDTLIRRLIVSGTGRECWCARSDFSRQLAGPPLPVTQ